MKNPELLMHISTTIKLKTIEIKLNKIVVKIIF